MKCSSFYLQTQFGQRNKHFPSQSSANPLMPELNSSEQHCLPEFFTGDFKF